MILREKLALKVKDAVSASGLGRTTLYDAMQRGELPYLKVGASRLIKVSDLDALLERHRVIDVAA